MAHITGSGRGGGQESRCHAYPCGRAGAAIGPAAGGQQGRRAAVHH